MAVGVMLERRRFTIAEYEKMIETGILAHDDRVELIDGEVIAMSPIGDPHAAVVTNLTHLLVAGVGEQARVRVQGPIRIPPRSVPQPDLSVLRPRSYMRESATAADALLIVEVADTSLLYDSVVKLRLYARAGIAEYWVVDTNTLAVDAYRSPSGDGYAEHRHAIAGETLTPLGFPDAAIPISSIFA